MGRLWGSGVSLMTIAPWRKKTMHWLDHVQCGGSQLPQQMRVHLATLLGTSISHYRQLLCWAHPYLTIVRADFLCDMVLNNRQIRTQNTGVTFYCRECTITRFTRLNRMTAEDGSESDVRWKHWLTERCVFSTFIVMDIGHPELSDHGMTNELRLPPFDMSCILTE